MPDKPTHEQLLAGDVYCRSIINELIRYEVDFVVKGESATARALRIWFKRDVEGES